MTFLSPISLLLLITLPIMAGFLLWRMRVGRNKLMRLGDRALGLANHHPTNIRVKLLLWIVAIAMLIIAMARPIWGVTSEAIEADGLAVIIVLDISQSMDAQDITPSRLTRAKLIISDLIENLPNVYVGMVVFAGEAYIQLPLTTDNRSALTFLNAVNTQAITQQGTALGSALDEALGLRDDRITQKTIMLVVSDGENHEGNPLIPAEEAKQAGIVIHTIGIGTPNGAEIPIRDEFGAIIGSKNDAFGNVVITRLDEAPLRQIATLTDGIYRLATIGGAEIGDVLGEINAIREEQVRVQIQSRGAERFNVFVALALIVLGIESLIPQKRRRES